MTRPKWLLVLAGFGIILFACVDIAWPNLIDSIRTYMALDDDEWIPDVALVVSIAAGLLGAVFAVFAIWSK